MHDQIPRHSLVTNLTHELRQMILDSQIQPGEYLPSQKDLAARFGVGLSTIHEAVQVLVAGGLLQARPGKGTHPRLRKCAQHLVSGGEPRPVLARALDAPSGARLLSPGGGGDRGLAGGGG